MERQKTIRNEYTIGLAAGLLVAAAITTTEGSPVSTRTTEAVIAQQSVAYLPEVAGVAKPRVSRGK